MNKREAMRATKELRKLGWTLEHYDDILLRVFRETEYTKHIIGIGIKKFYGSIAFSMENDDMFILHSDEFNAIANTANYFPHEKENEND